MREFLGVLVSVTSCDVSSTRGLAVKQPSMRVYPVVRLDIVPIYVGRVQFSEPMVTFVRKLRHLPLLMLYMCMFLLRLTMCSGALNMPTRIRSHRFSYRELAGLSALPAGTGIFYPDVTTGYNYGVDVGGGENST